MASDAMAPNITRSSAIMKLTMQDKQVLVFHEGGFQLGMPSWCSEMIENINTFLCFLKTIWHIKG